MKSVNPYYPRPGLNKLWDAIRSKNILAELIAESAADWREKEQMLQELEAIEAVIGTQNLPSARDSYDVRMGRQAMLSRQARKGVGTL